MSQAEKVIEGIADVISYAINECTDQNPMYFTIGNVRFCTNGTVIKAMVKGTWHPCKINPVTREINVLIPEE